MSLKFLGMDHGIKFAVRLLSIEIEHLVGLALCHLKRYWWLLIVDLDFFMERCNMECGWERSLLFVVFVMSDVFRFRLVVS